MCWISFHNFTSMIARYIDEHIYFRKTFKKTESNEKKFFFVLFLFFNRVLWLKGQSRLSSRRLKVKTQVRFSTAAGFYFYSFFFFAQLDTIKLRL
jgi:hypothetical protein